MDPVSEAVSKITVPHVLERKLGSHKIVSSQLTIIRRRASPTSLEST